MASCLLRAKRLATKKAEKVIEGSDRLQPAPPDGDAATSALGDMAHLPAPRGERSPGSSLLMTLSCSLWLTRCSPDLPGQRNLPGVCGPAPGSCPSAAESESPSEPVDFVFGKLSWRLKSKVSEPALPPCGASGMWPCSCLWLRFVLACVAFSPQTQACRPVPLLRFLSFRPPGSFGVPLSTGVTPRMPLLCQACAKWAAFAMCCSLPNSIHTHTTSTKFSIDMFLGQLWSVSSEGPRLPVSY